MSEFNNVTVTRAANVYFDGKVTSRKVTFEDGSFKTLGIMMPGDYTFGTNEHELMEITAGECEILLAGAQQWLPIKGGESFEVPANSSFDVKAKTIIDYCCSYIA
ncbi:pyrimidine/purine nucleoside phosphorylase [Colwellia sp. D2M02]|uniref:Pyrimidine/purine nucleoside phosphorylase n=1 Tax=Colwellia asteriadis TaxID=517723 RepID=A0ABP3WGX2_9GAMM|nr:pyrimidine/purine nucleoside phosphorylase [Colwellia sp. D2M02]MBU2893408.1 pyrimidine/purine nucleoside phosphorylase [Colwellia sp. D2M02]